MTEHDRDLIRVVEAKVDRVLTKLEYIEKRGDDHEKRLRSVERWKYSIPVGFLLAGAAFIGTKI